MRDGKDTMYYVHPSDRQYLKEQGQQSYLIKKAAGIKVRDSESEGIRFLIEKDKKGEA